MFDNDLDGSALDFELISQPCGSQHGYQARLQKPPKTMIHSSTSRAWTRKDDSNNNIKTEPPIVLPV